MMRCPPERGREQAREGAGKTLINSPVTRATTSSLTTGVVRDALWGCGLDGGLGGFLISTSQLCPSIFLSFLLGLCDKQHKENITVGSRPFQVRTSDGPFHTSGKKTQPRFQNANETTAQSSASVIFVHKMQR